MTRGSCLCRKVKFEIATPLHEFHYCHCGLCRKAHGSAFSAFIRADKSAFRFTSGAEQVREYRASPPFGRTFCTECGSRLTFTFEGMPHAIWVSAGAVDGDPGVRADAHAFVASKAPWFEITDGLEQYPQYSPFPDADDA